jgi:hypothetical protein
MRKAYSDKAVVTSEGLCKQGTKSSRNINAGESVTVTLPKYATKPCCERKDERCEESRWKSRGEIVSQRGGQ